MALRSMSPRRLANGGLFAARRKEFYDESFGRLDGRMGGWRDVALDGDRRGGGGPAGCRDWQAVQEIIVIAKDPICGTTVHEATALHAERDEIGRASCRERG